MKTLKKLIRTERKEVLSLLCLLVLSLFLYDNYLLMLLSLAVSLSLALLFLPRRAEIRWELQEEASSLAFLESFLSLLLEGWTTKTAYEQSLVFLEQQEKRTYEELLEGAEIPYRLGRFKDAFSFYLEKDRKNEAYLLSPFHVREEVKNAREGLLSFLGEEKRRSHGERWAIFLFLSLSILLSLLFPSLVVSADKGALSLLTLFSLSLLVPAAIVLSYHRLRRWKHA